MKILVQKCWAPDLPRGFVEAYGNNSNRLNDKSLLIKYIEEHPDKWIDYGVVEIPDEATDYMTVWDDDNCVDLVIYVIDGKLHTA